jgi:hypothetical protein
LEKYLPVDFRPLNPKFGRFEPGLHNSLCYRRIGGKKIMASDKQIEANRRNAQLSTGPKTEEGKAASSRNALKHGFRSQYFLRPYRDKDTYWNLVSELLEEHQARGVTEEAYVERMAITLIRLSEAEGALTDAVIRNQNIDRAPFFQQIEKLERAFDRSVNQLRKLQKDHRAETREARNQAPEPVKAAKRPRNPNPNRDRSPSAPPRHADRHADPPPDPIEKAS